MWCAMKSHENSIASPGLPLLEFYNLTQSIVIVKSNE